MTDPVIETNGLTVYYGKHRGIENLNLRVEPGEVFGFLGPNGAGKTTTQRVLMDVLRPDKGSAHIFGMDCQKQGVTIRERVGYLPGELSLPPNMKAVDFLDTLAAVRGIRDDLRYRRHLMERLDLDPSRRFREYSRGNKQKVGLVAAMMHRPHLLILDEPTGGLDPLVQQTVLELVREAKAEGRTVFFSSHVLSEVQAVCDRVGIVRAGSMVATERVEDLIRQRFRRLRLRMRDLPPGNLFALEGVTLTAQHGHNLRVQVQQNFARLLEALAPYGIQDLETEPVTLEEIFLAFYGNGEGGRLRD
jgi:ABC-2 type transport system ATP-binding protein